MSRVRPALWLATAAAAVSIGAVQKLTPGDIVQRHVTQALGSPDRAGDRANARGTCRLTTTTMGAGSLQGPFTITGAPGGWTFTLRFDSEYYEGEAFTVDGSKVEVAFAQPRKGLRSALGIFLSLHRVVLREGLLGGVLNPRWPLFDAALRDARLSYDGVKKFEGRDVHRVRFRARRDQGDLSAFFFFDPDTFNHLGSEYEASQTQSLGATPEASSQRSDQYFHLQEVFSSFETVNGAVVPKTWVMRYSRTGDSNTQWKYECTVQRIP